MSEHIHRSVKRIGISMVVALGLVAHSHADPIEKPGTIVEAQAEYGNWYNSDTGFPQAMLFRRDTFLYSRNKNLRDKIEGDYDVFNHKFLTEERTELPEKMKAYYNGLMKKYPEKLFMLHINSAALAIHGKDPDVYYANNIAPFFPGHWVYDVGATVTGDITDAQTEIAVSSTAPFSTRAYKWHQAKEETVFPTDILLVEVDEAGGRLWDKSEYVSFISKVDKSITVKRGRYGSKARSFPKGRTLALPIHAKSWADNVLWFYNLSSKCPKDSQGKVAADIFVKNVADTLNLPDDKKFAEGVSLDVTEFYGPDKGDVDNDGVADGGIIDGENTWRDGIIDFSRKLRAGLSEDMIITADSFIEKNQRAVGMYAGMEAEGLVAHNDAYRGISTTLNLHTYWQHYGRKKQLSFIADKMKDKSDVKAGETTTPFVHAVTASLGLSNALFVTGLVDKHPYLTGGDKNGKTGWLGRPVEGLRFAKLPSNKVISGEKLMRTAIANHGSISEKSKGHWVINADEAMLRNDEIKKLGQFKYVRTGGHGPDALVKLYLQGLDLTDGLTINMQLRSIEPLAGVEINSPIPRLVRANLSSDAVYAEGVHNAHYTQALSMMGTTGWHKSNFYFRANEQKSANLELGFEEYLDLEMKDVEIITGPRVIYRKFEHGMIIVNLSERDVTVPAEFNTEKKALLDVATKETLGKEISMKPLQARFIKY